MTSFSQGLRRRVMHAILKDNASAYVIRIPGSPKPLRPQAIRLHEKLRRNALRGYYLTAQISMFLTLKFWTAIWILPASSQVFEMSAIRACLCWSALMTLMCGLFQAWRMCCPIAEIEEI